MDIIKDSINVSATIRIVDDVSGDPELGVTAATTGLVLQYRRELSANVSLATLTDLASLVTVHTDKGLLHIGNGYYRVDVPDAAFAAGAADVLVHGVAAGMTIHGQLFSIVTSAEDQVLDAATSDHNDGGSVGKSIKTSADFVISTGTAQSGGIGAITLKASEPNITDHFRYDSVIITAGLGIGQVRLIISYNGTSKLCRVAPGWVTNPDNTSKYQIMPAMVHAASGWDTLHECYIVSATANTAIISSSASVKDSYYLYQQFVIYSGTGEGQVRLVTGYVGATREITINRPWDTTPDTTSQYVLQTGPHAPHIVDQILDELISEHLIAGSLGKFLSDIEAKVAQLTFSKTNQLDSNTKSINDASLVGDGNALPWDGA